MYYLSKSIYEIDYIKKPQLPTVDYHEKRRLPTLGYPPFNIHHKALRVSLPSGKSDFSPVHPRFPTQ